MISVCEEVAESALKGADVQELTSVFARTIKKTIVLLNPAFELRCQAVGHMADAAAFSWDPKDRGLARWLSSLASARRPLRVPAIPGSVLSRACLATPVTVGETMLGYLLIIESGEGQDVDVDLLIASYVGTLFALTLAHERTSTDLGRRYQAAVVDSLISGHFLDAEDARRKASSIGLANDQPYRIAVIRLRAEPLSDHAPALPTPEVEDLIGVLESQSGAIGVRRGSGAAVLLPETSETTAGHDQIASAIRSALAKTTARQPRLLDSGPTCGLSESTCGPDRAPRLLRQAETAVEIGVRIGRAGHVIPYDSLGIYRLLLQIGDIPQLWDFAEEVLGSVINYDATHTVGLISTLSVYFSQRDSVKRTARRLQVHANTVSYRIRRIEQLSSLDLTDPDDRLLAHVAIKIVESQRADTGPDRLAAQRANSKKPRSGADAERARR
jgi:sugar diacid utilization regulator